jgi:hypothetical protein
MNIRTAVLCELLAAASLQPGLSHSGLSALTNQASRGRNLFWVLDSLCPTPVASWRLIFEILILRVS